MLYLLGQFWIWMLAALVLGMVIGLKEAPGEWRRGLVTWLIVLAVGAAIAFLHLLPRRFGFWFEIGLLLLAAYLVGVVLAGLLFGAKGAAGDLVAAPTTARQEPTIAPPAIAQPAMERAVEPASAAVPEAETASEEAITGLSGPRGGKADDLTRIEGIDRATERKLNALGLYHYDQIAALTPGQRRWLFRQLGHEGRFPSWWWRWKHEAQALAGGQKPAAPAAEAQPPAGAKPAGLEAPRAGKADDLKRIKGIGKQNEGRLHGLGIWHFDQIAAWTLEEVAWVGAYLAFPGRIEREDWVGQAKILASGAETEFSKRADAGLVASSRDDTHDDGQGNVIAMKVEGKPPGRNG